MVKKYNDYLNDNFWKWFGKSKIVDDKGNPMIMYHGSPHASNIIDFKNNKGYHFFASDINEADRYSGLKYPQPSDYTLNYKLDKELYNKALNNYNQERKNRIKKFYIKAENPFDPLNMTDKEQESIFSVLHENNTELINYLDIGCGVVSEVISELGYNIDNIENNKNEILEYILTQTADNFFLLEYEIIQDWIKKNGYDSFYTVESGMGVNVAVYSPNQIKSAKNNNGNFSLTSNSIFENITKY